MCALVCLYLLVVLVILQIKSMCALLVCLYLLVVLLDICSSFGVVISVLT